MFRNIVLAGEEGAHASDLQQTFPAVHDGQLVHRHQILSQLLKVLAVGFLSAFRDAGVIHVDGLFLSLFWVGLEEGIIMWVGALPCILLVILLNKNYIVSVIITFFYTIVNYLLSMNDFFLTQPFGFNAGTLLPGPLAFRWTFQFYDQSQTSAQLADLLERVSPYYMNQTQVFGVIFVEGALFLILIALIYRRQEI